MSTIAQREPPSARRGLTPLRWRRWLARPGSDGCELRLKGHAGDLRELRQRTVVLFGTGAVGGVALQQLARVGIGTLICVDPDSYGEMSWLTQPVTPEDAGRSKAWLLSERAHATNPSVNVLAAVGLAQHLPLQVLNRADLFVAAGDNLELMVWAGTVAAQLGKPLLQGAVHGETWTALVRGYDLRDPGAPCPACALSAREWAEQSAIDGCDVGSASARTAEPTRTLPTVCATAGQLAAGEALKWLLGKEAQALHGEELAHCLLTHRLWRTKLTRKPQCPCPHRRWALVEVPESPADVTLATLAGRLGVSGPATVQVRGEVSWVGSASCAGCGQVSAARRFAWPGTEIGRCPCGQPLLASPPGLASVMPSDDLRSCLDRPLAALGLGPGSAVGLSENGKDWTYFLLAGDPTAPESEATS